MGSSAVILSGLSLGYAKYDPNFRRKIENSIPYSDKLLNSVLGSNAQNKDPVIPPIESKDKRIETSFMAKKKERTESLQLNQNNKTVNQSKKEDKTHDISLQSKPVNEKSESKLDSVTEKDSVKSESSSPKHETSEESSESSLNNSLLDINDILIAREALKEQLMTVLPTDGQDFKELQKRFNDIELEYERKVFIYLFIFFD